VLEENIMSEECVKAKQTLPFDGRIHSAKQRQPYEKTLPGETTTALKSGMTFTHKIVWGVKINLCLF
jgi:hypothetical protein